MNATLTQPIAYAAFQQPTLEERGIHLARLRYVMRAPNGGLSHREVLVEPDLTMPPKYQTLYAALLKDAPLVRKRVSNDSEAYFCLVNRGGHVVGSACFDMRNMSDRDFAWLNCFFVEA